MLSLLVLSAAVAVFAAESSTPDPVPAAQPAPPPRPGPRPPGPVPRPPPPKRGPPPKPQAHWEAEPFLKPEAGAQINTNGQGSSAFVTLGASAGFRYWRVGDPPPQWSGQTRVRGLYGTGSGVQSLDARIGSFIGPRWGSFGLQFGPDLFWNRLELPSGQDLEPSVGLEFPVMASLKLSKELSLYGGVSPAWLADPQRAVDWSAVDAPGFGDEFAYMAGASLNLKPIHLSANYVYRIVATGAQQNLGFGINFGL